MIIFGFDVFSVFKKGSYRIYETRGEKPLQANFIKVGRT